MSAADCRRQAAAGARLRPPPIARQLLERLGMPFTVAAPNVDESPLPGRIGRRSGRTGSRAARRKPSPSGIPNSLVIGSDQLAAVRARRARQARAPASARSRSSKSLSGQRVAFNTAVHVMLTRTRAPTKGISTSRRCTSARLSDEEIQRYVARDKPYDCAGGFKVEALGITLFDEVDSHDPTGAGRPAADLAGRRAAAARVHAALSLDAPSRDRFAVSS